jgi:acetyl-CoA carboxylase biotin carboxyl carrier protein
VVAGGGAVIAGGGDARARLPVDFGAVRVTVDPRGLGAESAPAGARAADAGAAAAATAHGRAFRAPTSGRFYGRPTPGAAPFVSPGVELAPGATICLLEVMKTFNRVTYAGEPARVREVAVADGADVNAGDVLLLFE